MDPEVTIAIEHPVQFKEDPELPPKQPNSPFAWRPSFTFTPPRYLWWSFLIFAILETLLIIGSYYFIQGLANQNKSNALEVANVAARRLEGLVNLQQAPIYAMASYVALSPNWPLLSTNFDKIAKVCV